MNWPKWMSAPTLANLQPKFDSLQAGSAPEAAEVTMGAAIVRHETSTVGVSHLTLEWRDFNSIYTARFLAGRLYNKSQGPLFTTSKG